MKIKQTGLDTHYLFISLDKYVSTFDERLLKGISVKNIFIFIKEVTVSKIKKYSKANVSFCVFVGVKCDQMNTLNIFI